MIRTVRWARPVPRSSPPTLHIERHSHAPCPSLRSAAACLGAAPALRTLAPCDACSVRCRAARRTPCTPPHAPVRRSRYVTPFNPTTHQHHPWHRTPARPPRPPRPTLTSVPLSDRSVRPALHARADAARSISPEQMGCGKAVRGSSSTRGESSFSSREAGEEWFSSTKWNQRFGPCELAPQGAARPLCSPRLDPVVLTMRHG